MHFKVPQGKVINQSSTMPIHKFLFPSSKSQSMALTFLSPHMDFSLCFFLLLSLFFTPSSSTPPSSIFEGSSLSVDRPNDVLISLNGVFTSGFHSIGDNAFIFAIWFTKSFGPTVVWTANRDQPVNGKGSKLLLQKGGKLILTDAGKSTLWTTAAATNTSTSVQLSLNDSGNLILSTSSNTSHILWQSFDSPTNTLLPHQLLTRYTTLISSRSGTNHSSGFYKLFFDNNNALSLLYTGPEVFSIYWPDPWVRISDQGRTRYNSSNIAVLDSSGHFISSDNFKFSSADFGLGPQRRLTLDIDGNLRLYSLDETTGNWTVTWQATSDPCKVHGVCGPNGICSYGSGAGTGRGCFCVPGYRIKNSSDWSYGCELDPSYLSGDAQTTDFVSLNFMEFFGYEYNISFGQTLESCKKECLESAICKGFLFKYADGPNHSCYAKSQLLNGKTSPHLLATLYVKLNVSQKEKIGFIPSVQQIQLNCSGKNPIVLDRIYKTKSGSKFLEYLVWFACGVGLLEILCVFTLRFFVFRTPKDSGPETNGYFLAATTFKRFSYAEIKKATHRFNKEIGRGGYGVVYKGTLLDNRVAAIKRLNDAKEGEAEFLAEVSTIGRLNHMNLIEMWGYCVEGKHRLLVSEFMKHGSLADNLNSNTLDSEKRYSIAVGIAKGLSYLHEECLEWVLHCDIKPQNILLDANYQPKVADFGLSKLLNRGEGSNLSFSKMRGTRGYMAPEWVFNHPITSKVDVYSYGIVVLEMITGRSPTRVHPAIDGGGLVTWVRNKKQGAPNSNAWIEEILDPTLRGGYEMGRMETLVRVAMQCVEDDKDARPTMRKVVEMLSWNEDSLI